MRELVDKFFEAVFSEMGFEFLGLGIFGVSVLLLAFSVMQRVGIAPASRADQHSWYLGVVAAAVLGIFGFCVAALFWPR
jgi:hypothetical protein